jgi:hypothetical protein
MWEKGQYNVEIKWEIGKQIWKREKCFIMTGGRGKGMEWTRLTTGCT